MDTSIDRWCGGTVKRGALYLGLAMMALGFTEGAGAQSAGMQVCADCHPDIYTAYRRHGMAQSLGTVRTPPRGTVKNPRTGQQYRFISKGKVTVLEAVARDGGLRRQQVIGRIGAGILDTSWATVELDLETGRPINRIFFAPVETVTGHGLELSPFEHSARPAGMNMAMTQDCLTCHTDSRVNRLPGASSNQNHVFPAHALGADAFRHLQPLQCDACHGDTDRHVKQMQGLQKGKGAVTKLSRRSPPQQRDICARCHLQGDVRFQLVDGRPSLDRPLAAQVPVLVSRGSKPDDDFRFVSQLERLVASACFQKSPQMTCTTCHDPHRGVRDQGLAKLESACLGCHTSTANAGARTMKACSRAKGSSVRAVTGQKPRSPQGCIDCHVRRSQPFDLPGIRSTDHYIRRRISKPRTLPFRAVTRPDGPLRLWGEPRMQAVLKTPGGQRWQDGVVAMGLVQVGRPKDAAKGFERFVPPGHPDAIRPTAPPPLVPLETWPSFHQLRALSLLSQSKPELAQAAFQDALRLEPHHPGALMGRARLAVMGGDFKRVLSDTQGVIDAFPQAEAPWQIRTFMAARLGNVSFQIKGLQALLSRWPSDPQAWMQLAQLYGQQGATESANQARRRVQLLSPHLLTRGR